MNFLSYILVSKQSLARKSTYPASIRWQCLGSKSQTSRDKPRSTYQPQVEIETEQGQGTTGNVVIRWMLKNQGTQRGICRSSSTGLGSKFYGTVRIQQK